MALAGVLASVALVAGLWPLIFRQSGVWFWAAMSTATGALGLGALLWRGPGPWAWRLTPGQWALGLGSALLLWALFVAGNRLLLWVAPGVSASGDTVYGRAGAFPKTALALLLLLVIGPGEEFYWRGLLQWHLAAVLPAWGAVLLGAAIYAAVHLSTRSPALVLAALICGLYWGGIYALGVPLPAVVVSHALWDCLVLLWLPLPTATVRGGLGRGAAGVG